MNGRTGGRADEGEGEQRKRGDEEKGSRERVSPLFRVLLANYIFSPFAERDDEDGYDDDDDDDEDEGEEKDDEGETGRPA